MIYTIYDKSSGQIIRELNTLSFDSDKYDSSSEAVYLGRVDNGKYIDISTGSPVPYPAKPLGHLIFNYTTKEWVDARDIEDTRLKKNAQINKWRATANMSSFTFSGKQIACDALSRSDIDATNGEVTLTGVFPVGWPGAWKAVDNTYVSIPDVPTWTLFYQAMTSQGLLNFQKAQTLKTQLAAATTLAEVDAIQW